MGRHLTVTEDVEKGNHAVSLELHVILSLTFFYPFFKFLLVLFKFFNRDGIITTISTLTIYHNIETLSIHLLQIGINMFLIPRWEQTKV